MAEADGCPARDRDPVGRGVGRRHHGGVAGADLTGRVALLRGRPVRTRPVRLRVAGRTARSDAVRRREEITDPDRGRYGDRRGGDCELLRTRPARRGASAAVGGVLRPRRGHAAAVSLPRGTVPPVVAGRPGAPASGTGLRRRLLSRRPDRSDPAAPASGGPGGGGRDGPDLRGGARRPRGSAPGSRSRVPAAGAGARGTRGDSRPTIP